MCTENNYAYLFLLNMATKCGSLFVFYRAVKKVFLKLKLQY
ncbi:unnamed protein product [Spodoptera exigua]|nr:unnamed protein product [Spodoptera exigua]